MFPAPAIGSAASQIRLRPEWVAVSTVNLIRQPPNCDQLLRYPSWNIGDGTIMVFHITDSHSDVKP